MKKKIVISLSMLFIFIAGIGQSPSIAVEQWNEKPSLHKINPRFKDESAIIVQERRRIEYFDDPNGEVGEYYTQHDIIRINDDKGIQSFNRVYLGASNSIKIIDVRARTILPGGRIVEIDKNNIKDIKEEDGGVYKIFALEGLEKGCEVEYFYTYRRETTYFGRIVVQRQHPIEETLFEILAPERLVFEIKAYNHMVTIEDTVIGGKRRFSTSLHETSGIETETYASYEVNLKRLEYKLSYNNSAKKGERLFTWNDMAKRIYENYTSFKDKEINKVDGLIKQNGWEKLNLEEEKIVAVENYLKKNIATREDIEGDDANNIEMVIKNKIASFKGVMRLYAAIFQQLKVNYQFVYVCDRNNYIIDKTFENWNNCEAPIFYYPSLKKFMAPTRLDFRYPFIFPSWAASNGLFCKTTSIGNFTTAIAEIREVPLEDFSKSFNNIETRLELNRSLDTVLIDMKQLYGGYEAQYYRAAYYFSSADDQRKFIKDLIKFGTSSENISSSEVQNKELESALLNKPFILHATVKASELLENAGNKLLLKIGEIIGPQVEMYQEKPRQLPVKIEYPHSEERKIEFVIPEGYNIKNINDLKLERVFRENGEITMGFSSDYKQSGNVVTIHIMEQYCKTYYPLVQFDEFRKIINTSADFNKIILVLEKK